MLRDCSPYFSVFPSQPPVLYGRDAEVNEIAGRIISTKNSCYALTGAGGIGKTALAMAVWEHTDIVAKYGDRRFCFRCEQATSAAGFLGLLASVSASKSHRTIG